MENAPKFSWSQSIGQTLEPKQTVCKEKPQNENAEMHLVMHCTHTHTHTHTFKAHEPSDCPVEQKQ